MFNVLVQMKFVDREIKTLKKISRSSRPFSCPRPRTAVLSSVPGTSIDYDLKLIFTLVATAMTITLIWLFC